MAPLIHVCTNELGSAEEGRPESPFALYPIAMDGSISESVSTLSSLPSHTTSEASASQENIRLNTAHSSIPSSPRSNGLPSPPDSPADSVSSLPSVTSSFFFSSAAASPGHFSQPLEHDHDHASNHSGGSHEAAARHATRGLIIPSLTLPPALRRPTPYGQTLGEVRLLVLGRQGAGKSFLTGLLLEDNEEVVEVGTWEDPVGEDGEGDDEMVLLGMAGAKVLRASTDWVEHSDGHGLENFEPARNVEIVELPGYDSLTDGNTLVSDLRNVIQAPFQTITDVVNPNSQPSALLANIVASAATPLFTALILLLPSAPTPLDRLIIESLGGDIPIIVLSTPPSSTSSSISASPAFSSFAQIPKLSTFRPFNSGALKHGLFRSPETVSLLRTEAAERFMRWREIERASMKVPSSQMVRSHLGQRSAWDRWDKEKWEREWMEDFSRDVSVRIQQVRALEQLDQPPPPPYDDDDDSSCLESSIEKLPPIEHIQPDSPLLAPAPSFDPLHIPSLFLFTVSMLGPLKARILQAVRPAATGYHEGSPASTPTTTDGDNSQPLHLSNHKPGSMSEAGTTTLRWFLLGGLVSAGFCVGVSVGAALAVTSD